MDEAGSVHVLWYATGDHDFCSSRLPLSIKQRGTVGSDSPALGLCRLTAFTFPCIICNPIEFSNNGSDDMIFSFSSVTFNVCSCTTLVWYIRASCLLEAMLVSRSLQSRIPRSRTRFPGRYQNRLVHEQANFSILNGGILPFGAVFIELFFILTSIWLNQFYHFFGFLFLVFYHSHYHLEDYLWWWRSYLTSGSSALHLFLYATFYFFTNLEITKPASGILYLGYMLIAS
ncbi:unnamed protein product, partial [Musa banksii]